MNNAVNIELVCATMKEPCEMPGYFESFVKTMKRPLYKNIRFNSAADNLGVVGSYQWLYERADASSDIIAYVHDDVECYEPGWDLRVIREFLAQPSVGIVGFGGAVRHGAPDLYRTPYYLPNLARFGYRSNTRDAEGHGDRFAGSCNVAVLDGFVLCIRKELLDRINGWTQIQGGCDFIGYDYSICAIARRYGYAIRMVGVDCMHYGGGTSVAVGVRQIEYDNSHRWFYEHFTDVMPCEVIP